MSAPVTTAVVLCTCGHGRPRHYGELAPQCSAPSCTCLRFRPDLNAPAAVRTPGPAPSGDSTARPTLPRCTVCSHGKKRHEVPGFAPSCVVSDCECSQYTDQDSVTPEASKQPATFAPAREAILALAGPEPSADAPEFSEPPAESAPTVIPVDELLRRGHESELKPIARLAERIDTLLEDLRDRLADEAAATGVKDLISDLEQQLADAKAKLRGVATGRRTTITAAVDPASVDGSFHCPECPKTFSSAQGVTMHRTRSHGYRKAAT